MQLFFAVGIILNGEGKMNMICDLCFSFLQVLNLGLLV